MSISIPTSNHEHCARKACNVILIKENVKPSFLTQIFSLFSQGVSVFMRYLQRQVFEGKAHKIHA